MNMDLGVTNSLSTLRTLFKSSNLHSPYTNKVLSIRPVVSSIKTTEAETRLYRPGGSSHDRTKFHEPPFLGFVIDDYRLYLNNCSTRCD